MNGPIQSLMIMNPSTKHCLLSLCLLLALPCLRADDYAPIPSDTVEYLVANASVCPVRENPSYGAEQATQLLFGEVCELIERQRRWTKVRSTIDGQVGWVSSSMLTPTLTPPMANAVVVTPMATAIPMNGEPPLLLTLGTRLANYAHGSFEVLGQHYLIDSTCVHITTSVSDLPSTGEADLQRSNLVRIAQSLLNTPYLWGGKNAMGLDCSGFTQVVYAAIGVNILRNAREQITQGEQVNRLADALPGDLAFFGYTDRNTQAIKITHVGLLLSPTEIIHCAGGRVHVDRIDTQGIYLPDGTMTHHLIQIRRYL